MREPSIHIKRSDLIVVLERILKVKDSPIKWDYGKLATEIIAQSKGKSLSNRSMMVSNDKLKRSAEKINASGKSETALFVTMLTMIRKSLKHRGIRSVQPGEPEWYQMKEACALAQEFCNEFGLQPAEGYKIYITLAIGKMKKFSLNRFKAHHSNICAVYEAQIEIETDPDKEKTKIGYDTYMNYINEKIGYSMEYDKEPEKYVSFVKAKNAAREMGVSIKAYIRAQFYGLEWAGGIPDPQQLYGDRARERVVKYHFENNIPMKQKQNVDLSKIRRR